MEASDLARYVIIPTLHRLTSVELGIDGIAARQLVLGTAMVESDLRFLHQVRGPALGLWQMEPATHDDIWEHWLQHRPELVEAMAELGSWPLGAELLCGNLYYAAAMCRIHYRRHPSSLPPAGDSLGLARMWKAVYNTRLGKGTVERAQPLFLRACKIIKED